jgi:hypothetical protein
VAQDIVRHFLGRGFVGKAMVVSIDKATALRMHDKVKKHWAAERRGCRRNWASCITAGGGHDARTGATRAHAAN